MKEIVQWNLKENATKKQQLNLQQNLLAQICHLFCFYLFVLFVFFTISMHQSPWSMHFLIHVVPNESLDIESERYPGWQWRQLACKTLLFSCSVKMVCFKFVCFRGICLSVCVFSIFRHLVFVHSYFLLPYSFSCQQCCVLVRLRCKRKQQMLTSGYPLPSRFFCQLNCSFQLFKSFADRPCLKLDRLLRKKNYQSNRFRSAPLLFIVFFLFWPLLAFDVLVLCLFSNFRFVGHLDQELHFSEGLNTWYLF